MSAKAVRLETVFHAISEAKTTTFDCSKCYYAYNIIYIFCICIRTYSLTHLCYSTNILSCTKGHCSTHLWSEEVQKGIIKLISNKCVWLFVPSTMDEQHWLRGRVARIYSFNFIKMLWTFSYVEIVCIYTWNLWSFLDVFQIFSFHIIRTNLLRSLLYMAAEPILYSIGLSNKNIKRIEIYGLMQSIWQMWKKKCMKKLLDSSSFLCTAHMKINSNQSWFSDKCWNTSKK